MQTIDFVTEEYAKAILHLYGAYRHYDRVDMLEDAAATGPRLAAALLEASRTHTVDVLLLVHGRQGGLWAIATVNRSAPRPLPACWRASARIRTACGCAWSMA